MAKPVFTHFDAEGKASMVCIGGKEDMERVSIANSRIYLQPKTLSALKEKALVKGDVLTVAKIAGIQAAKQTSTLIPLCHHLPLHHLDIQFQIHPRFIRIKATVSTKGKTGVEMEALVAVSVAALTIYDMCKAVDKKMKIGPTQLLLKTKRSLASGLQSSPTRGKVERSAQQHD